MFPTTSGGASFAVSLPNLEATHRLAIDIANALEPGDFVTLSGDLGAGKTTLARAVIRYLAGDSEISVPSPTFILMQHYDLSRFPLVHADLYRLNSPSELAELGFDDLPERAVVLLEWPDRAAGFLPADRLDVALTLMPEQDAEARNARITGYGKFAPRAERITTLRKFLDRTEFADAERIRMQGDASTRIYEHLSLETRHAILMNAPRRADGPPVRHGRPYSAIAHLAEDVKPFVALAQSLRLRGFSTPEIFFADVEAGFLILEDLGTGGIVEGDPPQPIDECYTTAIDVLIALHSQAMPEVLPVPGTGIDYRLPPYDMDAFQIEAELLLDWYLPRAGITASDAARSHFVTLWQDALKPAVEGKRTWVLRDFHSPNLLWLPRRQGLARLGLLDFQDAVMGPAAYDVASLLQDARVDVSEEMEISLLGRYAKARREHDAAFDAPAFIQLYATLAAQRASKILGIFSRLDRRDGKPQYLRHIPRIWSYLQRSLAHPALAPLNDWYGANVPLKK
ncbi:MAG: tRNA (adenosine(37)-N6)-threonylcarbamoyltransferase complex ATPase subunit type 1 TsaE [Rhizobiales bacterium]|nr:tRNA (adenosine(37)-N6)-threonylcarbamoyltransferase complex ATPase subunit type 1 TsaE [Hyphomicrobiales bacterium]